MTHSSWLLTELLLLGPDLGDAIFPTWLWSEISPSLWEMSSMQTNPLLAGSCIKPLQMGMAKNLGWVLIWKCKSLGAIYHPFYWKKFLWGMSGGEGADWGGLVRYFHMLCPVFHGWDVFLLWVRFTPGLKLPFGSLSTLLFFPLQV